MVDGGGGCGLDSCRLRRLVSGRVEGTGLGGKRRMWFRVLRVRKVVEAALSCISEVVSSI